MIIVMAPDAPVSRIGAVIREIERLGYQARPSHGRRETVIGVVGARAASDLAHLADFPGVVRIEEVARPYKLVAREAQPEPTVIPLRGAEVGGREFVVMAGPCSVESRDQLLETARIVVAAGARVLRGGAFKPRTSPYSFQGLGEEGLRLLAEARAATGLDVVTEVMSPEQVDLVAAHADILQVGARNMQNYALLEAVGRSRKPVLLKRGMMSTLEELLLAAEYVMANGNRQVMLCERGIRTFETTTRNTCDIGAVPALKSLTHLPVVVDPSHAVGVRDWVPAVARAALAAGADGIIVEVHPRPEEALSDGAQSLTPDGFAALMESLARIAPAVGRSLAGA